MTLSRTWVNTQNERLDTIRNDRDRLNTMLDTITGMIEWSQNEEWWDDIGEAFNILDEAMKKVDIVIEDLENQLTNER